MTAPSSSDAPRKRFSPSICDPKSLECPPLCSDGVSWVPLISASADFPLELFEVATTQLIHHPEYNSTLILRSDTIAETPQDGDFPEGTPNFNGLNKLKMIHRRLLPRRPGRDSSLDQYCTLYGPESKPTTLVLSPITQTLPYYHPAVVHLGFRYISNPLSIRIEVLPLPDTPTDPNSRLYRTCLALLETLHRYGWGAMTNYKKRVLHDTLVPRDLYQDMYLVMRDRHKHLVSEWQEVTDPLKHVFEDIGIATYLILLWKDTYKDATVEDSTDTLDLTAAPWKDWPQPPGGFLDFGCGNGLLTHILTAEGFTGVGIDVRARQSWASYPATTQACLQVHAFVPAVVADGPNPFFRKGVFVIGNHADELTPLCPVLAAVHDASGYLSIPCCPWTFDTRYERSSTPKFQTEEQISIESLNLGGEGSNHSAYSSYRIWLASLSLYCGWEIECEMMRIPSTRNWAIIGRKRHVDAAGEDKGKQAAEHILEDIETRGSFKPRKPEGKACGH